MASLEGMITVAEAARRLNRSIEQVRRYLREGKLSGRRTGNRWFVEEAVLKSPTGEPLVPRKLMERIDQRREAIRQRLGYDLDVVELVRRSREEH